MTKENIDWKYDILSKLKRRNEEESLPFRSLIQDYNEINSELSYRVNNQIEAERIITSLQHDINKSQQIDINDTLAQLRKSKETLRSCNKSNIAEFYSKIQSSESLMNNIKEELRVAKSELLSNYEKLAVYEEDIRRLKQDIELVCVENETLKKK